ncbi:uncharacterized protein F5891DRAFT_975516 [Suillus fuscotomentosus]|uniref:Uncharacterized protein n=1 Tax=Suillus fuscotomentosus TaxID=1912939 RepID=A0AAD4EKR7_9AGAM|nr:uncharacterized protein F5891DRAFT_975516 [Suillus fuscotomentosus]KAG1906799.1 hypothetical protein F5891DRAFT_975516 [Suillus fuscotomentosus]
MEQNNQFNNAQAQGDQFSTQANLPDLDHAVIPEPLIVTQSAISIWRTATQAAQSGMSQNRQQAQIHTTEEERCWLILMALQREQELDETTRWLRDAWQELDEVRSLLGIARNQ